MPEEEYAYDLEGNKVLVKRPRFQIKPPKIFKHRKKPHQEECICGSPMRRVYGQPGIFRCLEEIEEMAEEREEELYKPIDEESTTNAFPEYYQDHPEDHPEDKPLKPKKKPRKNTAKDIEVARKWRKNNAEKHKQYNVKYRAGIKTLGKENPKVEKLRVSNLKAQRKYSEKNKEKLKAYRKQYYEKNKKKYQEVYSPARKLKRGAYKDEPKGEPFIIPPLEVNSLKRLWTQKEHINKKMKEMAPKPIKEPIEEPKKNFLSKFKWSKKNGTK